MKALLTASIITMLCWIPNAIAGKLMVAAASNLQYAMEDILEQFRDRHPNDTINVVYGSSGKLSTQIAQGAPYDLYFSADITYPRQLARQGLAASEVMPYGVGRIVLWSATRDASAMTLKDLASEDIQRIAIANPRHAPYGARAREALEAAGVWPQIQDKLILGSNISQAAQFVETGNAQAGIIALSLIMSPRLASSGSYWLIPDSQHKPLEQGYIITQRAADNELAWRFSAFLDSDRVRQIMRDNGFDLPDDQPGASSIDDTTQQSFNAGDQQASSGA
ncbi:molybdate ABC transporter substrate-binding protein [Marinobacter sp. NP-4(2019)]|uniref:molybdate ABC transporter substrate-binding protein n=1 Tax=Marinobacter sp. NP-4(2019) TaxID=2488665 RepID=UPI00197D5F49|nr:molybdate ABC transporter substrate-binding protein [Marinobacter sp. NP-4(2019)]